MADVIGRVRVVQLGIERIAEAEADVSSERAVTEEGADIVLPVSECVGSVERNAVNRSSLQFRTHAVIAGEALISTAIQACHAGLIKPSGQAGRGIAGFERSRWG